MLDEMLPHAIAEQLRRRGHDVVAATEDPDRYSSIPDDEVLSRAQEDRRAVVTDNLADFVPLASAYERGGERYYGVIYATRNRFDRSEPGTVGALVRALDHFLRERPGDDPLNQQHYLERRERPV